MSYISGLGGVTPAVTGMQPAEQAQQRWAVVGSGGHRLPSSVPDLYPRRRPLGQRHTDSAGER